MDDYISRKDAYTEIMGQPPDAHYADWYGAIIQGLPAADVRPVVRGKWLLDTVYPSGVKKFRCSICGYDRTVHERYEGIFRLNFCPRCGADMREEAEHGTTDTE